MANSCETFYKFFALETAHENNFLRKNSINHKSVISEFYF